MRAPKKKQKQRKEKKYSFKLEMFNLEMFNTEADLQELTGLTHDGLLKAGFDLDDWDFGVVTNRKLASYYDNSYGDEVDYCLTQMMGDWCCGYQGFEYNGKFYYLVYHS